MRRASQLLWRCLRPAASPAWSAAPARSLSLSLSLSLPLTTSSLASVPLSGWSAARSGWAAASSALRARARTVAAVALAAVPALALYDEGLARAMYFNAHALPCLAHYRLTERLLRWRGAGPEETDAALARLHELYAPMSLRIVLRLRGFYIKLAQLGDFIAEPYISRWEALLDSAPAQPLAVVERLLGEALGRPAREVFAWIAPEPLGSASIGQVHRARLVDGREVAVKVQYPSVERLFRTDLRCVKHFCRLAQPEHLAALEEVERTFGSEFDYTQEADALACAARSLALSPFAGAVAVPSPVRELCSRRVLVMAFLDGEPLLRSLRRTAEALAAARGVTPAQLRAQWAARAGGGGGGGGRGGEAGAAAVAAAQPPAPLPPPRPFGRRARLRRAVVRGAAGCAHAARVARVRVGNLRRRLAGGRAAVLQPLPPRPPPPPDVDGVLSLLAAVAGYQLFHDGLFNADCHPGNVLCLSDGRLGLVDYGQAARLAPAQRAALARLTLALADGRVADAARLFRALGYAPGPAGSAAAGGGGGGDGAAFAAAVVAFDRDDRAVTGGLNVQAWLERQARADPGARWPDAFVMASRASFLLRGCGIVLGRPLSVAQAWRPAAEAFLRASGEPMV